MADSVNNVDTTKQRKASSGNVRPDNLLDPAILTPTIGQIVWDTDNSKPQIWNGSAWEDLGGSPPTPPPGAQIGRIEVQSNFGGILQEGDGGFLRLRNLTGPYGGWFGPLPVSSASALMLSSVVQPYPRGCYVFYAADLVMETGGGANSGNITFGFGTEGGTVLDITVQVGQTIYGRDNTQQDAVTIPFAAVNSGQLLRISITGVRTFVNGNIAVQVTNNLNGTFAAEGPSTFTIIPL